jgi:hypothetical protein
MYQLQVVDQVGLAVTGVYSIEGDVPRMHETLPLKVSSGEIVRCVVVEVSRPITLYAGVGKEGDVVVSAMLHHGHAFPKPPRPTRSLREGGDVG